MLESNIKRVLERINKAAERSGRNFKDILLVAVTKNVPPEVIRKAYEYGLRNFGENRAQELRKKYEELKDLGITWHFIGRIQTNKVRYFVPICEYVHSVWREEEVTEISKRAGRIGKIQRVLVEVNVFGEETKAGLKPEEVEDFLKKCEKYENVFFEGLMTMAPYVENPEEVRWGFRKLRELRDYLMKRYFKNAGIKELSMGMSNDFEVAVEEGATMVRIGTAIFRR
ncbi:MAG: YggS family pyridoxal phosphate-dependent enzyme [Thermotoga sp.]|nr:MAG: YggS family pyridoxal phosphate-dependent enzyme [Thermotoga sp.]